jgi:hypothetical protein
MIKDQQVLVLALIGDIRASTSTCWSLYYGHTIGDIM